MVPLKYAYLALTTMITSPMTIVLPVRLYVRALSHEAYLPTYASSDSLYGLHVFDIVLVYSSIQKKAFIKVEMHP